MSIDNVKLLNEINMNFITVLEKYSNNKRVLNKVNDYVKEKLNLEIEKMYKEENDMESTKKERDYFVNNFLSSMENIYYYVKENDLFIHYDMKHYKCVEEDQISSQIYNDIINNHPKLSQYKFDIQNEIVDEYKTQLLVQSIPESDTIQNVIKFLMTYFFDYKDDAKYFCCILGDLILNKQIDNVFCINENLLNFIISFQSIIEDSIDSNVFIYKSKHFSINKIISSFDITKHRILYATNTNKLSLWNDFLNRHAIDIYSVCVHYSKRYLNSEKYLTHHKTPSHILYLKTNNIKTIVETFGLYHITVEQNSTITYENMKFLWYKYLKSKQIPTNIIYDSRLHKDMLNYAKYDTINSKYLCVNHPGNSLIITIREFIDNCIEQQDNDQLEISEFIEIYQQQYNLQIVDENSVVEVIKYFTDYKLENDDKTINNVKCLSWDKKGELNMFINMMKTSHNEGSHPIQEILSFNAIYTKYCKYTSNNGNVNKIVTKKYFINHILSTIPNKFIYFNKVLQTFWSN